MVRELHRRGVLRVHPTWTTRPRRADEGAGSLEHRFVSEDTFDALCEEGFFLGTVALFGLPYRYGVPPISQAAGAGTTAPVDAIMLRAPVLPRFAALFPDYIVYQIDDQPQRNAARLHARACPPAELAARLDDNRVEAAAGRRLADRVFINDRPLPDLADQVAAALIADCRARAATPLSQGATP